MEAPGGAELRGSEPRTGLVREHPRELGLDIRDFRIFVGGANGPRPGGNQKDHERDFIVFLPNSFQQAARIGSRCTEIMVVSKQQLIDMQEKDFIWMHRPRAVAAMDFMNEHTNWACPAVRSAPRC